MQVVGSVYIPEVNYVMMILTVVVIAIFKTTVQLGNAYGKLSAGLFYRYKTGCKYTPASLALAQAFTKVDIVPLVAV